jgi:hypothetical protein
MMEHIRFNDFAIERRSSLFLGCPAAVASQIPAQLHAGGHAEHDEPHNGFAGL